MSGMWGLAAKNLARRPGRSAVLVAVSLFLSCSVLAGTLVVRGLQGGLSSLQSRLGADIMVVPYEATTKHDFSNMLLQGTTGMFFMNRDVEYRIAGMDGVAKTTSQFFLATAKASCCSSRLQIIAYDPQTDFTVSPWIRANCPTDPGYLEIVVGSEINVEPGERMKFYGTLVMVKAKLERTGTYLDTAVFTTRDTVKALIRAAKETKMMDFGDKDPDALVSCVLVDVAEGRDVDEVVDAVNLQMKGVKAVRTQAYVTGITSGMRGISRMIGLLVAAVWVLALAILMLAFVLIVGERKKEFAILRVLGATRRRLAGVVMRESLMVNGAGSCLGVALALLVTVVLRRQIQNALGLPFLLPGSGVMAGLALATAALALLAGSVAAAVSAGRISHVEPALILRGDN